MKPVDMADVCARALADPGAIPSAVTKPPTFYDGCVSPPGQICAGVWLPWEWADLPEQEIFYGYLWPACQRLLVMMPVGFEASDTGLQLPVGVAAGLSLFGDVAVRVIVMDHPVPTKELVQDLNARLRPWYNTELDEVERRNVVPLLRLDMKVKPKE